MTWKEEMQDIRKKRKWFYKSPLPRKKQRVEARAERCGKCKVYTEEEKLLYLLRHFRGEVSTE